MNSITRFSSGVLAAISSRGNITMESDNISIDPEEYMYMKVSI